MAAQLLAACKRASGGAALDRPAAFHEHGTFTRDGVDGAVGWRAGPDGVVQRVTDPERLTTMRTDAYLTIGGWFYPDRFPVAATYRGRQQAAGRSYDVIQLVPAGGSPINLWLDAATHRLGRITDDTARGAYAQVLSYRWVDGTLIGFGNRQVEAGHTVELRLHSYVYEPLRPQRFAVPAP